MLFVRVTDSIGGTASLTKGV